MTNRERMLAILTGDDYDGKIPLVHFGFWDQVIDEWIADGHLPKGYPKDRDAQIKLAQKLGFDVYYNTLAGSGSGINPPFPPEHIKVDEKGFHYDRDGNGVVSMTKPGIVSIPVETDHLLKDRQSWETNFLPRLGAEDARIEKETMQAVKRAQEAGQGEDKPIGLYISSFYGKLRNWMGIENLCYLYADDEALYIEMLETVGRQNYECLRNTLDYALSIGLTFDFGHIWEDICFRTGPLVNPDIFRAHCGPWMQKCTDLCRARGMRFVSVDCDGDITKLAGIWAGCGVAVMFPVEYGAWEGDIQKLRTDSGCGVALKAVGGMNKMALCGEYRDIDREIVRLQRLCETGGFIPCPDHLITPSAKWENVQYYCDRMRKAFGW